MIQQITLEKWLKWDIILLKNSYFYKTLKIEYNEIKFIKISNKINKIHKIIYKSIKFKINFMKEKRIKSFFLKK